MGQELLEMLCKLQGLSKEEQNTIFSILDAFLSKRKLKSTLKTVLQEME